MLQKIPLVTAVHPAGPGAYELESSRDGDPRPAIAQAVVNGGWGLLELRSAGLSLEDIFRQLAQEAEKPAAEDDEEEDEGDEDEYVEVEEEVEG